MTEPLLTPDDAARLLAVSRGMVLELRHAQSALDRNPGSRVHFKFTCAACGTRCTLEEPNMLREAGECFACGATTTIREGGYMLVQKLR